MNDLRHCVLKSNGRDSARSGLGNEMAVNIPVTQQRRYKELSVPAGAFELGGLVPRGGLEPPTP